MRLEGHVCIEVEADDGCFMIDKVFEDEPSVYLEDMAVDDDIKASLQEDVILFFPNALNVEEDYTEIEESRGKKWIKGTLVIVPGMTGRIEM
ncbi:hypothetical protein ACFX12_003637 [Malus domestica]